MVYGLEYTETFKKQVNRVKKKDRALMEELMKKVRWKGTTHRLHFPK